MKKIFIATLLVLTMACPNISSAVTKSVTIDWTMSDTTNVTGYKMYYSYSSDMSPRVPACETNDPAVTSLTCANVDIAGTPVYFAIAAVTAEGELTSGSKSYVFPAISVVQDFGLLTPGDL